MSLGEPGARLEADRALIANGMDFAQPLPFQIMALMRVLNACAQESVEAGSIDPLMRFLYANIEATEARIAQSKIACKKGCSFCCHMWVSVSAPEAIYAVKAIGAGAGKRAESIRAAHAATSRLSLSERREMMTGEKRRACPLLESDACSIHPWRPILCRSFASFDARMCERALTNAVATVPVPPQKIAMRDCYMFALAGALAKAGLAGKFYEYNSGLDFLLDHPEAEHRWLAGEDIFAGLREDPGGDLLRVDKFRSLYEAAFRLN